MPEEPKHFASYLREIGTVIGEHQSGKFVEYNGYVYMTTGGYVCRIAKEGMGRLEYVNYENMDRYRPEDGPNSAPWRHIDYADMPGFVEFIQKYVAHR